MPRATLANHDGILFPGLIAHVRVITSTPHRALLVPEKAIVYQISGVPHVAVVNERNKVDLRKVQVGLPYDGMRVVTAGLGGDEWVVAEMGPVQPPMK